MTLSALEILEERCVDLLHGRNPVALMVSKGGGLTLTAHLSPFTLTLTLTPTLALTPTPTLTR